MAFLSSFLRGSVGVRNLAGQCARYRLYNSGAPFKSHLDLDMCSRLLSSTRTKLAGVNPTAAPKEATGADAAGAQTNDAAATYKYQDPADNFKKGKYPGTGLPKAVGPPEDLPSIEFGKPTGLYNFVRHQHGDPRSHLQSDGRYRQRYASDGFHWYDAYTDVPKQKFTIVNGETMIMGNETRPMEELFGVEQTNIPFHPRRRVNLWGNHKIVLSAEFCFFWIPTFIILSMAVPCYTMIYMMDEAVATSMTVKVIGHQWYWVYEVESPPLVE
ncbi:cytochrome c oxidase subunit 2, putative [Babesia caballi]|uniref:Cytochrome c oxidase subunit 2, putative n=1 Tax=Babesia caballi TaxID=5871 RepID=A0AAV4M1V4_BABCB|nr:cytochrome c oxidase subunit 2, putative [Babesia caballi]